MRIPIKEWSRHSDRYSLEDEWRITVLINGEDLHCTVRTPASRYRDVATIPREYIVREVARRIGSYIADEIQRSIA